jgi:uncharacterized DUF497 family protein
MPNRNSSRCSAVLATNGIVGIFALFGKSWIGSSTICASTTHSLAHDQFRRQSFFLTASLTSWFPCQAWVGHSLFVSLEVRYSTLCKDYCIYIIDAHWDLRKAQSNRRKHGVSLEEARAPSVIHAVGRLKMWSIRRSNHVVAAGQKQLAQPPTHEYTIPRRQDEEIARIISARGGSRKERPRYEVKEDFRYY